MLLGLGWVNEHLPEFALFDRGPLHRAFTKDDVARLKPMSELALTCWLLKRCGVGMPFLDWATDFIWRECEDGRWLVKLLLARNDFLPCCALYAPLYRTGHRCRALPGRRLAWSDCTGKDPTN